MNFGTFKEPAEPAGNFFFLSILSIGDLYRNYLGKSGDIL